MVQVEVWKICEKAETIEVHGRQLTVGCATMRSFLKKILARFAHFLCALSMKQIYSQRSRSTVNQYTIFFLKFNISRQQNQSNPFQNQLDLPSKPLLYQHMT